MDLLSALSAAGLVVRELVSDGEIQRCGTVKKPRSKNGWYIVYEDGKAACFGNWETGDGYDYWQDGDITEAERGRAKAKMEDLRRKRENDYLEAADKALEYIEGCADDGFSDYLKNKRIYPHGAKFDGNVIIIPCQDASGKVWSYQKIYGDGSKYFMPGGRVRGCYYMIAGRNVSKDELVVVCEGFATGAAIHQVTGLPVIVAFNAGNLLAVCRSVVFRNLVIAADNDESGVGEKAAKETGYPYHMPPVVGWDYSDMFLEGREFSFAQNQNQAKVERSELVGDSLVAKIADWITATAVRPQPDLSMAAALAFVGMIKGKRIRGKTNLRTNMLCLSLAPTASGKEHPQFAIDRLADACGLARHMMGRPTSGAALLTGIEKAGGISMLTVDEMGRYIGNITLASSGGHQREITDYMVELFSSAGRTLRGRQYASDKERPQVILYQPHFCCLGSTVAERLQQACTSSEVVDGFLNRWLVFSTDKRPEKQRGVETREPPQALVDTISDWLLANPLKQDNYGNPQPETVEFTPEAWDMFVAYDKKMDDEISRAAYPADKLYSRAAEHVEKIAMTLADSGFIGTSEVAEAIRIVTASNRAIMGFSGMIADNKSEQDFKRVEDFIRKAGETSRSDITYRCQFVDGGARRIAEIITTLVDKNVIAERKDGKKMLYKFIG